MVAAASAGADDRSAIDREPCMLRSALLNVMIEAARKAGAHASSATSARSRTCRSRSRARRISSPPPIAAPRRSCARSCQGAARATASSARKAAAREGTDKTHTWIVDPLDGTTNFLHGIPQFAISIGLEREGTIVAGLVYNPINDELFIAERGKGAFLNDQRLRVAARQRLADAVVACGLPHLGRGDLALGNRELAAVQDKVAGLRRFGAAALDLAWVAAGRFDAYWERDLSPWDIAAGLILVREAGGFVTDLDGGDDALDQRRRRRRQRDDAPRAAALLDKAAKS